MMVSTGPLALEGEILRRASFGDEPRFLRGLEEYRAARHFEAHEHWEALWLKEPEPRTKSLLQALIQIAAAMHKLCEQRAPKSAARLLDRALARLRALPADAAGLAIPALIAELVRARAEVEKLCEGSPAGDPIAQLEPLLSSWVTATGVGSR